MFWPGIAEGIFTRTPFGFETRDFLNFKSIFSVLYFKKLLPLLGKRNGTISMHALSIFATRVALRKPEFFFLVDMYRLYMKGNGFQQTTLGHS